MKEMFERVIALKNYDLKTLLANIARTQNNAELLLKGLTIH